MPVRVGCELGTELCWCPGRVSLGMRDRRVKNAPQDGLGHRWKPEGVTLKRSSEKGGWRCLRVQQFLKGRVVEVLFRCGWPASELEGVELLPRVGALTKERVRRRCTDFPPLSGLGLPLGVPVRHEVGTVGLGVPCCLFGRTRSAEICGRRARVSYGRIHPIASQGASKKSSKRRFSAGPTFSPSVDTSAR